MLLKAVISTAYRSFSTKCMPPYSDRQWESNSFVFTIGSQKERMLLAFLHISIVTLLISSESDRLENIMLEHNLAVLELQVPPILYVHHHPSI